MPVDPNAAVEVVAYDWVPDMARGYVRDFRVRWALEEVGVPYRTRLISVREKPLDYFLEQPFGQVPAYRDADVAMFESAAIVLHIGERSDTLLPRDAAGRARAQSWVLAAMNSMEPMLMELVVVDVFARGEQWAPLRRPGLVETIRGRLSRLSDALGTQEYLEGSFTAGDLLMASALRALDHTDMLAEFPNLAAYQARCTGRPAFKAAIAAQFADFTDPTPIAA